MQTVLLPHHQAGRRHHPRDLPCLLTGFRSACKRQASSFRALKHGVYARAQGAASYVTNSDFAQFLSVYPTKLIASQLPCTRVAKGAVHATRPMITADALTLGEGACDEACSARTAHLLLSHRKPTLQLRTGVGDVGHNGRQVSHDFPRREHLLRSVLSCQHRSTAIISRVQLFAQAACSGAILSRRRRFHGERVIEDEWVSVGEVRATQPYCSCPRACVKFVFVHAYVLAASRRRTA